MIEVDSKTFKSGNSEAVRLPKEVALGPDIEVTIRKVGDTLTIAPKRKKTIAGLIAALERLPKPDKPWKRERIIFPKRKWD
ncbi:AbrB/MazE/SpoVT family DNA-binding domain-containing protein [Sphingomonas sp. URHD0057]|uniref:antitoxin n=1 Tax=Sphingomonas sp. URHD0057 TaxID=1380389 RepID=UPI00048A90F1|nr:AbrB/MazE/SpoVT family DNA-binding domain-containing protein [Sphingomonas sp. URHD0057]